MLLLRSKLYLGGSPMFKPVCVTFHSEDAAAKFIDMYSFTPQQAIIRPGFRQDVICKTKRACLAAQRYGTVVPLDDKDASLS